MDYISEFDVIFGGFLNTRIFIDPQKGTCQPQMIL